MKIFIHRVPEKRFGPYNILPYSGRLNREFRSFARRCKSIVVHKVMMQYKQSIIQFYTSRRYKRTRTDTRYAGYRPV